MHQVHHFLLAFSLGVFLIGTPIVGAEVPGRDSDVPVVSATLNPESGRTAATQRRSAETVPVQNPGVVPDKSGDACVELVIRATEMIFNDRFESGDLAAWQPDAGVRFSAVRILDLDFTARFAEGFSGDHIIRLKLFTPKGHHYQTLDVPIASDPARSGSLQRVEGYPRPLPVRVVEERGAPSLPEVTLSVPVGGTPIVTSSIYGKWTAEVYLDASPDVCVDAPFTLTP